MHLRDGDPSENDDEEEHHSDGALIPYQHLLVAEGGASRWGRFSDRFGAVWE
jgi:hypothetical protein